MLRRKDVEAKLAKSDLLMRAARLDELGKGERLWQSTKVAEAEKLLQPLVEKSEQLELDIRLVVLASLATVYEARGKAAEAKAMRLRSIGEVETAVPR